MTLNQQGFITWTPEANQLGNHTVKVQVNDGRSGFIEQEWTIAVVSQRSNNQAPQILSTPSLKANINQVYQYNLVGNDPDGDPIFLVLETRPQGMSLDVTKGTIRWQPKFDQIGLHEVVIQVIDTQEQPAANALPWQSMGLIFLLILPLSPSPEQLRIKPIPILLSLKIQKMES